MTRYLRLYAYFVQFSFSRAMEFRVDFTFRIFMDSIFYVVQFAFFGVLYRHIAELGGWNWDQVVVFVAGFLFTDAVNMTFFSNNLWHLPQMINQGDVDYYLVRPVSSLFFLSMRDLAANSFVNLIIASGILVWALMRYPGELSFFTIFVYLLMLLAGNILYAIIQLIFLIPTFWFHSHFGLREVFFNVQRYMERPDQIFYGFVHRLLISILPFALIISYPTHILFTGVTVTRILHIVAVLIGMFAFLVWFWNKGLRAYSSASS
ncbi:ABC-2 family transporter protein [bacterium]|nr:ABC-2 family transporter protein [bacterium]